MADPNFPTGDEAKKQQLLAQHAENRVAAIMLESGVIFHSIFIGIDLGINPDPSVVRPLMIALMFHQVTKFCSLMQSFLELLSQYKSLLGLTVSLIPAWIILSKFDPTRANFAQLAASGILSEHMSFKFMSKF